MKNADEYNIIGIYIIHALDFFSTSSRKVQHTLGPVQAAGLDGSVRRHSAVLVCISANVLEEGGSEEIYHQIPMFAHEIWWNWTMLLINFWDRVFGLCSGIELYLIAIPVGRHASKNAGIQTQDGLYINIYMPLRESCDMCSVFDRVDGSHPLRISFRPQVSWKEYQDL